MVSPGKKKGQRRGSCGHVMASFDLQNKCARCQDKHIGEDQCEADKPCTICNKFIDAQREMLSTPTYRMRKEKKTNWRFLSVPRWCNCYRFSGG